MSSVSPDSSASNSSAMPCVGVLPETPVALGLRMQDLSLELQAQVVFRYYDACVALNGGAVAELGAGGVEGNAVVSANGSVAASSSSRRRRRRAAARRQVQEDGGQVNAASASVVSGVQSEASVASSVASRCDYLAFVHPGCKSAALRMLTISPSVSDLLNATQSIFDVVALSSRDMLGRQAAMAECMLYGGHASGSLGDALAQYMERQFFGSVDAGVPLLRDHTLGDEIEWHQIFEMDASHFLPVRELTCMRVSFCNGLVRVARHGLMFFDSFAEIICHGQQWPPSSLGAIYANRERLFDVCPSPSDVDFGRCSWLRPIDGLKTVHSSSFHSDNEFQGVNMSLGDDSLHVQSSSLGVELLTEANRQLPSGACYLRLVQPLRRPAALRMLGLQPLCRDVALLPAAWLVDRSVMETLRIRHVHDSLYHLVYGQEGHPVAECMAGYAHSGAGMLYDTLASVANAMSDGVTRHGFDARSRLGGASDVRSWLESILGTSVADIPADQFDLLSKGAGMLSSEAKSRRKVLEALGDSALTLMLASKCVREKRTAQEYQEARSYWTSNSTLTAIYAAKIPQDMLLVPAGVVPARGNVGAQFIEAVLGVIWNSSGQLGAQRFIDALGLLV